MTRIELHPASQVFIIVLGAVFAVEFAIMLVVETTGIARADRWTASLADALLVVWCSRHSLPLRRPCPRRAASPLLAV
jgi:hypothetical protein